MDKHFQKGAVVHALDTNTGTWRDASILHISKLTVTVLFPGFRVGRNSMTETIDDGLTCDPSKWPIRNAFAPPETKLKKRGSFLLGYEPGQKIVDDVVRIRCFLM